MKDVAKDKFALASAEEILAQLINSLHDEQVAESAITMLLQRIERLPDSHASRERLLVCAHQILALKRKTIEQRRHERSLKAVFDIAQSLTELKDLKEVLQDIVSKGRQLIGSDVAWLAGKHASDTNWSTLAVEGGQTSELGLMGPSYKRGIAGYVYRTGATFTTSDYGHDARFDHDPGVDATIAAEGLLSFAAVPLMSESSVKGILIVGDRYNRVYRSSEVSILATLAAHASVAVANAESYEETKRALLHVEKSNEQLHTQAALMEQAAEAHDRLTRLLAMGGSLEELIKMIDEILAARVSFTDPIGLEVIYSGKKPKAKPGAKNSERATVADPKIASAIGQSRSTGKSVTIEGEHGTRTVCAVMSGDELFGSLDITSATALTDLERRVFERGATAAAVVLMAAQRKFTSELQDVSMSVRALLDPLLKNKGDIEERLRRFGLHLNAPIVAALVEVDDALASYVARKLAEIEPRAKRLVTEIDGNIFVLANSDDVDAFTADFNVLLFKKLRLEGHAAFSGPIRQSSEMPATYVQLRRTVGLLKELGRKNQLINERELRFYSILFQQFGADDIELMTQAVIGKLVESDEKHGTRLQQTLLAYLDHSQNARAAAKFLDIHTNTMHNRLEQIAGLIGNWDRDGRSVEIHIALRLKNLRATHSRR